MERFVFKFVVGSLSFFLLLKIKRQMDSISIYFRSDPKSWFHERSFDEKLGEEFKEV